MSRMVFSMHRPLMVTIDLSESYGSILSKPNWNPDCDFNGDGKVDASDLFDLSKNYGKTI